MNYCELLSSSITTFLCLSSTLICTYIMTLNQSQLIWEVSLCTNMFAMPYLIFCLFLKINTRISCIYVTVFEYFVID